MPLLGGKKDYGQAAWFFAPKPPVKDVSGGWRFSLKGSPRHYDDVVKMIEADPNAKVYFGEALTYERGAGVALWRVEAKSFSWLPKLYDWWAEMERLEPVEFTFHLYMPADPKYPAMDLREHTPAEVEAFIKANAPTSERAAQLAARRT
jgi:hypothetical protein